MKVNRLAGFLIAILLGMVVGVVYGWVINPGDATRVEISSLRADYKTDYVLMVSEGYAVDGNISAAMDYLEHLQPRESLLSVQAALLYAQQTGYSDYELQLMANLEKSLVAAGVGQ